MNRDFTTLSGTKTAVWDMLEDGVRRADAPARTVALATRGIETGARVRLVVLRDADRERAELVFYTNRASSKVAEILSDPSAEALVWDAAAQFQIRLLCTLDADRGPDEVWTSLGEGSRRNYASDPQPGTVIPAPEKIAPKPAREAFLRLTARIEVIETLQLARHVQRRARFDANGARWIAP